MVIGLIGLVLGFKTCIVSVRAWSKVRKNLCNHVEYLSELQYLDSIVTILKTKYGHHSLKDF